MHKNKIKLVVSLAAVSLCLGPPSFGTNYSSINNQNTTYAPEDGEIIVNNTNVLGRAVGWTSGSGTTVLEGNINVNSAAVAVTIHTTSGNAHLEFKTVKASDKIVINSTSNTANGVVHLNSNGVDSSIVFDTSASDDKTVYVTNTGGTIIGVRAQSGEIIVKGNLDVSLAGSGIQTMTSDLAKSRASVYVTGNAVINSTGEVGLEARSHSDITIDGNADITSREMGIYSFVGCTVTIGGSLSITSSRGIEATNGKVILNGIHGMNLRPNASAIDVGSNTEGYVGTVIGNAGVYKFTGLITASKNGLVDLDMRQDSDYTGYTRLSAGAPGTINLSLTDTSRWTLTNDSTMTDLNVGANSSVVFTISGQKDFTDITLAVAMLESGSIVTVNLDGYDPVLGDEFRLLIADTYDIDDDIIYDLDELNEGLSWDTSDFATTGTLRVVAKLIPEPSSATLALSTLAALAWRRRKPR